MLQTLHIKNIGIIDDITVDFEEGLNVLTGETGAGKSLILSSLNIILGGRFSKEMIRKGEEKSFVEACIFAPDSEYSEDSNILVSREININGKNLCKINGRLVTVTELKKVMGNILDIHGQHDNQKLMDPANHVDFIDLYAGEEMTAYLNDYKLEYMEYKDLQKELSENFGDDLEKQRTLDLLTYQLNEIDEANLVEGEEEEIEKNLKVAKDAEKIMQNVACTEDEIENKIITGFENTIKYLGKISDYDEKYLDKLERMQNLFYEVQDISMDISSYKDDIDFSNIDINSLQMRKDTIFSLKRKYGNDIAQIFSYRDDIEAQIDKIRNIDEYNNKLRERIKVKEELLLDLGNKIHDLRCKTANNISGKINNELKDLEMKNAKFMVDIVENDTFKSNGMDNLEFKVATNKGEDFKSLAKTASGGEISRIMLAIKTVLSEIDKTSIAVFDEIDTGISGVAAKAVSEKISKIAKTKQVLCVTHQAVLAASADNNYFIFKKIVDDKTFTNIKKLNYDETINEIARIATGVVTEESIEHAKFLKSH